jgi:hypothetical protein
MLESPKALSTRSGADVPLVKILRMVFVSCAKPPYNGQSAGNLLSAPLVTTVRNITF